ncbi:DUF3987 domain-containing protein [Shewanella xiamenensis]|uniref:YfjI family protein n=1 Tax=Shewanella xiamenensis TaxID=332186 RepID=A0ABT6UI54_9GAMM|nr:DUF3987 domain-containing protein [Shewanella xiamenensis]MDI5833425.1 YfjI family protein [Shewanella xiamenensis]
MSKTKHTKVKIKASSKKSPKVRIKSSGKLKAVNNADKTSKYSVSGFESRVYDPTEPIELEGKLPKIGLKFVQAISAVCAACPEFVVTPLLCILSLILSNLFRIRPYAGNKAYLVTPNLSGVVIAPPGSNKSSALQFLMQIVKEIESSFAEKFVEKSKEFDKNLLKQQMDNQYFKKEARRLNELLHTLLPNSPEASEVRDRLEDLLNECTELPKRIYSTILTVQDPTLKGLMQIAANQKLPVLISKDELAVFIVDIHDHKNGDLRRYLIEAMDGRNSHTNVNANKRTVSVRPPVVSIIGTTQPSVIGKLINKVLDEKIVNDGYLDRFQCIAYPNPKSLRPSNKEYADVDTVRKQLKQLFETLYNADHEELIEVNLSEPAKTTFENVKDSLVKLQESDAISESVKTKLSKYPDMVLSLALVMALLRQYQTDPKSLLTLKTIKSTDIQMAASWAKHYLQHLKKLWGSKTPKMQNALKILKNINKLMDKDRCFTTREITQRNWAGIKNDSNKAKEALKVLVNEGVIESVKTNKNGRPSEKWKVIVEIID